MRQSEQINELAGALAKAQAKIEGATKEAVNPHFRNKYADLGNVWAAIREPLTSNGLSVVQLLRGVERGIECETILMHGSGQFIAESLFVPASKNDAQGYGSAATYARRYGLQAMVGIAPVDDDGEGARGKNGDGDRRDPPPQKPGPKSVETGTPLHDAHNEITNGTASTVKQRPINKTAPDPKKWAASDDALDFLRGAKADLGMIDFPPDFSRWMEDFRWQHDAIIEHGTMKGRNGQTRSEYLGDLISEAQDRCRAAPDLRAAG